MSDMQKACFTTFRLAMKFFFIAMATQIYKAAAINFAIVKKLKFRGVCSSFHITKPLSFSFVIMFLTFFKICKKLLNEII